jgi:hypothetical protein
MTRNWFVVGIAGAGLAAGLAGTAAAQDEAGLRAAFTRADRNADGVIDIDEYVAYFIEAFRGLDRNGDGFLVLSDFDNPDARRFRAADRDGDGRISLGEGIADRIILFFDIASNDGTISFDDLKGRETALKRR